MATFDKAGGGGGGGGESTSSKAGEKTTYGKAGEKAMSGEDEKVERQEGLIVQGPPTYREYLNNGPKIFIEIMLRRREPSWSPGKGRKGEKINKGGSPGRWKKREKQDMTVTPGRRRLRQEVIVTKKIKRLGKPDEQQTLERSRKGMKETIIKAVKEGFVEEGHVKQSKQKLLMVYVDQDQGSGTNIT